MPTYRPTNPSGSATGRPTGQGLTGSEETRFRVGRGGGTYRYTHGKDSVNVFIDAGDSTLKCLSITTSSGTYAVVGRPGQTPLVKELTKTGVATGGLFFDHPTIGIFHVASSGALTLNTKDGAIEELHTITNVPYDGTLVGFFAADRATLCMLYLRSTQQVIEGELRQLYSVIRTTWDDTLDPPGYSDDISWYSYVGLGAYCYYADTLGFYLQSGYDEFSLIGQMVNKKRWVIPFDSDPYALDDVTQTSDFSGPSFDEKPHSIPPVIGGTAPNVTVYEPAGVSYGYGGTQHDTESAIIAHPIKSNYLYAPEPCLISTSYSYDYSGDGVYMKTLDTIESYYHTPEDYAYSGAWQTQAYWTVTGTVTNFGYATETIAHASEYFQWSSTYYESVPSYSHTGQAHVDEYLQANASEYPHGPFHGYPTGYAKLPARSISIPGAQVPGTDTRTWTETLESPFIYLPGYGVSGAVYESANSDTTWDSGTDRYAGTYSYSLYAGNIQLVDLSESRTEMTSYIDSYQVIQAEYSSFGYVLHANTSWSPSDTGRGAVYAAKVKVPTEFTINSAGRVDCTARSDWRYFINGYELLQDGPIGAQINSASPCYVFKSELGAKVEL